MPVLIAYASRHGATRGIAERIADRLRAAGAQVDVRPTAEVRDVAAYDAVVVGAAAYMYHWLKDATRFVERNRATLTVRPTWLFSSGPVGRDAIDARGRDVLEACVPREFAHLRAAIQPRGERVFFGAWDPKVRPIGLAERLMRAMPATTRAEMPAGDFRDWPAIDAWADEIAAHIPAATVATR
jgi:menaquinone-dependent protoporphyrinogen oxidase